MQNYYQFIIPRLNGSNIRKDFGYYQSLVKKGIAGFIIFGGELEQIRAYIKKLQSGSDLPLIICSDLERGLGQQIKGGTLFPPAMAMANAVKNNKGSRLLQNAFSALAKEAEYAGINTILAPVLDINTNPKNPIISIRSFGEDRETVSFLGSWMIRTLQRHGIAACGKHFPGHGDTEVDSHIKLPFISRDLKALRRHEIYPFKKAVEAGVKMIMLGHLSVPAIDPAGTPVSISEKAVSFIRKDMKYKGILITDAMNMGGLGKYSEEKASFMALNAGVDIILHPSDADKTAERLKKCGIEFNAGRLNKFRKGLFHFPSSERPDLEKHEIISRKLTEDAISVSDEFRTRGKPLLVILNDEDDEKGRLFEERLKTGIPDLRTEVINKATSAKKIRLSDDSSVIVAIFSETKAWKGGAGTWLYKKISNLEGKADIFVSFGSPYILDSIKKGIKIFAYWDSEEAQEAAAERILKNR